MRLINADEVISVSMYDEENEEWSTEMMTVEEALCFYGEMPKIIELKQGRWICGCCDQCGYVLTITGLTNYCPNCGARMETDDRD